MNTTKKLMTLLLVLMGMTQAAALEYEYVPFVREGVKWVYYYDNSEALVNPSINPDYKPGKNYFHLELKGDTVINGKTYKAMHKYSGASINWENDTVPVYLREEDKIVYGIIPDGKKYFDCPVGHTYGNYYNGQEFVLYDFVDPITWWDNFINIGWQDIFYYQSTDTIRWRNQYAKRYYWKDIEMMDFYQVEGIGADSEFNGYTLLPYKDISADMFQVYFYLSHVIEDGRIIYKGIHYNPSNVDEHDNVVIDGLCYILNEENRTATVTNYSNAPVSTEVVEYSGDIVIPEIITTQSGKSYIVTAIDYKAFYRCNTITSMSIPPSIKTIGYYAFVGCNSLERVYIQDIAAWCNIVFENINANPLFSNYYNVSLYVNGSRLTQLDIPKGVTSIGNYAFYDASLSKVSFPNTLVSIGNYAFHNNSMTEVILPESLESLGIGAFAGCASLEKVQLNDGLEVIPIEAFAGCSQLSEVSLPLTIKKIEDIAFLGCQKLSTMPMTDSLQVIGDDAFHDSGIEQLKTGKSLTSIGEHAFSFCHNLTRVEISDPVTALGQLAFYLNDSLQKAVIGNGVHKIPKWLFSQCSNLTSVTLGNAVDTLEEYCFEYCEKIDTIVCMATVPPVMNGAEDSFFEPVVFQNATLYVPMGSVEAYKTANVWKNFQNIVGVNQTTDQDYEYVPFVREGVKWVYYYYNSGYIPYDGLSVGTVYLNLEIKGDTIINGKTYKVMHKYYGGEINELNDTIPVYLREENRVVYGIVPDGKVNPDCFVGYGPLPVSTGFDPNSIFSLVWAGEEFVLYDFNNTQSYYEDFYSYWNVPYDPNYFSYIGCDTITIGNRFAKRHKLTENYHEDYIIEGIGFDGMNPGYTLAYFYMQMANFPRFHLSHVIEDGRIIYKGIHYIPGDVNGDGEINIADANSVIDVVIMGGNSGHTRVPAADMNDDGEVNITDVNEIINLIINNN